MKASSTGTRSDVAPTGSRRYGRKRWETVGYGQGMSFENGARSCKVQVVRFVSCFWLFWGFLGLFFSTASLPAANVLISPGFEANPAGTNQPIYGWQSYGNNVYSLNGGSAHSGSTYLKVYGGFIGADNYAGVFQDAPSGPGAVYSADGWAFRLPAMPFAGRTSFGWR